MMANTLGDSLSELQQIKLERYVLRKQQQQQEEEEEKGEEEEDEG